MEGNDTFRKSEIKEFHDVEGNTFVKKVITIGKETFIHSVQFADIDKVMKALQQVQPRKGDVMQLNYAKAGTHWMYEILHILLNGKLKPTPHFKTNAMVELIDDPEVYESMESPRLFNSHIRLKYIPQQLLDKSKIVIVVRNPKSTAVSYYYHWKGVKEFRYDGSFKACLQQFFMPEFSGNVSGDWFQYHFELWEALKTKPNALFVFYEDLKKDSASEIYRISQFLELGHDFEFCEGVAELSSFDNMQKHIGKEEIPIFHRGSEWKTNEDGFFRKGTCDDWKNTFTVAQNEEFDKIFAERMKNYPDLANKIKFQ